jgi:MGT family glycosyltransferase
VQPGAGIVVPATVAAEEQQRRQSVNGKHIAFVSIPAQGHVNPTLPLVAELCRRGHRVTYATGPEFAAAIRAAGAEPLALEWTPRWKPQVSKDGQNTEDLGHMLHGLVELTREQLPVLERTLRAERPDLLCYDLMSFLGPVVADRLGLPEVATWPHFAGNERFDVHSLLVPADFDPTTPAFQDFLAARRALAADLGVAEDRIGSVAPAPLNLVFIPREFQVAGETFDERFRFVGPAIGPRTEAASWRPPDPATRVLFVSLGTAFNARPDFFAMCTEAFGDTDWHVAMAIGVHVDPADLGPLPANFDVRPYFPQPRVLEHATVFLSHAGMGSTMEALLFQVPLVAFPQQVEQHSNARRLVELGLGRTLDRDVTAQVLRRTVEEAAADGSIRENLVAMARHIAAAGGPRAGADALEDHLGAPNHRERGTAGVRPA